MTSGWQQVREGSLPPTQGPSGMPRGGVGAEGAGEREDFLKNKLVTAPFFMERLMPETALRKTRIEAGADTGMELAAEAF